MYDITFLGNAPIDLLLHVPEEVLEQHNLKKGDGQSVSTTTLEAILKNAPESERLVMPGGSGANTAHAFSGLGGKACVCAYVGDDDEGQIFYEAMNNSGVDMPSPVRGKRSLIIYVLITPDGERTFIHTSGDATLPPRPTIASEGLLEEAVQASQWLFIEGYLFAEDLSAIVRACSIARKNNTRIALALAEQHFVKTYFNEIALLIRDGIDLYTCNEHELEALKNAELTGENTSHREETLAKLRQTPHLVTYGKKGATYCGGTEKTHVPTTEADKIVDATGAGDAFAGGYFFGILQGRSRAEAISLGHSLAGRVIQQVGARLPDESFESLQR